MVDDSMTDFNYDMIISRDLLKELGIVLDFGAGVIVWQDISGPVKDPDTSMEELYYIPDDPVNPKYDLIGGTLNVKYKPADLQKYVRACKHLMLPEQNELYVLLKKFEDLFDGTLGCWTRKPYHIELKPGAKPYYSRHYPVPKAY